MSTGTTIMNVIKAQLIGILTVQQIHDIACIAQEDINASNSVISNDDLEGICLVKPQEHKLN
jgi:hypothetical protein